MAKIAVLGMGAMGSRIALSFVRARNQVTVWNRNPAKAADVVAQGAIGAATPAAAVAAADFVLAMVRDVEASRRVWLDPEDGALAAMRRDAVAIESSTITVAWARELAAHATARGIAMLDAPVSGSRKQADARELIFLAGGDEATVERSRPVLLEAGKQVQHLGPAGAGTAIKLMVNSALASQLASVVELLNFAKRNGIDPQQAMTVFNETVVASPWIKANTPALLARDYTPQFTVELIEKDLGYALDAGQQAAANLPVTAATKQVFASAVAQQWGDDNLTAIARLYE